MSIDHRIALGISILGFLVLILGSLGYMGVYSLDKTLATILMGIGIAAVIAGMAVISLVKDSRKHSKEEE